MRAARADANQAEIIKALRKAGASVQSLHRVGQGTPDLLCGLRGTNYLLEVKDGKKPPSARKLSADEKRWHDTWSGSVHVVSSVDDALIAVGCSLWVGTRTAGRG